MDAHFEGFGRLTQWWLGRVAIMSRKIADSEYGLGTGGTAVNKIENCQTFKILWSYKRDTKLRSCCYSTKFIMQERKNSIAFQKSYSVLRTLLPPAPSILQNYPLLIFEAQNCLSLILSLQDSYILDTGGTTMLLEL